MNSLSLTINNTRVIDGLIFAANSARMTPEAYAEFLLTQDGKRYADARKYGVVTSATFFAKFTPEEYSTILTAAKNTIEVPEPIGNAPTEEEQSAYDSSVEVFMAISNPTEEEITTYQNAIAAYETTKIPDNQAEIDAAEVQNAEANEIKALLNELTSAERVALDDQRVTDGLALLVSRELLGAERPAEITAYERPFPGGE